MVGSRRKGSPTRSAAASYRSTQSRTAHPAKGGGVASWSAEIGTLVALVPALAVAQAMFVRVPSLAIGAIAGLVAALGCRRWWTASIVGALAVSLSAALSALIGQGAVPAPFLAVQVLTPALLEVVEGAIVAAAVGAVGVLGMSGREHLRPVVATLALVAIVVSMWASALYLTSYALPNGLTYVQILERDHPVSPVASDEELYVHWVARVRAGEPFYQVQARSFTELAEQLGPDSIVRVTSPFSYRLPTLYAILAALPNAEAFVVAMLVLCSVAVASAYVLGRQFAGRPLALVAALLVAARLSSYGTIQLMDGESWAGLFVLCSVAAFVVVRAHPTVRPWLQVVPVGFALAAVAFRELALPLVVLGLIATLLDSRDRSAGTWIPWLLGLLLGLLGLGLHWYAASRAFATLPATPASSTWFHPDGSGLVGVLANTATMMVVPLSASVALLLLGMAGSLVAPRDWVSRVMLAGVAVGGPLALLVVHPPSHPGVGAPAYWGYIVVPVILACVPLSLARLFREPIWGAVPGVLPGFLQARD